MTIRADDGRPFYDGMRFEAGAITQSDITLYDTIRADVNIFTKFDRIVDDRGRMDSI
jgi:hypothetical protein